MGANYYLVIDPCPHCGRGESRLHIGKSSAGWCFALHVDPDENINSLDDWKSRWEGNRIEDEYRRTLSPEEMLSVIVDRSHPMEWGDKKFWGYDNEAEFHRSNCSLRGPNNLLRSKVDGKHCIGHGDGTWDLITGEFS